MLRIGAAFEPRVVPIHKTVDPRHVHRSRATEPSMGTSEHAWPRLFRQPILNSDPKPESDLKERC